MKQRIRPHAACVHLAVRLRHTAASAPLNVSTAALRQHHLCLTRGTSVSLTTEECCIAQPELRFPEHLD